MRIYYIGDAADGPRAVDYNGCTLLWAVPGIKAVKKVVPVKNGKGEDLVREDVRTGRRKPITHKKWVNATTADGEFVKGPRESFLDLDADAVRWVMNQAHNEDKKLVFEKDFRKAQGVDAIKSEIAELEALLVTKEEETKRAINKTDERRGPGRPRANVL